MVLMTYILLVGFDLNANYINQEIEKNLSENLGRKVLIDGPSSFRINAKPSIVLRNFYIANPDGFTEATNPHLFSVKEAKLSLNLWGLLYGRLIIDNVSGQGLNLDLIETKDGRNNWSFKQTPEDPDSLVLILNLLEHSEFKNINLNKLNISYQRQGEKPHTFKLKKMDAHLSAKDNISINLEGIVEDKFPYKISAKGHSLQSLINVIQAKQPSNQSDAKDEENHWPFELNLDFLESHLNASGTLNVEDTKLAVDLKTPDLRKFGKLLDLQLPNTGIAEISSNILIKEQTVQLDKLTGTLGKSKLTGKLTILNEARLKINGEINLPTLDFTPLIQADNKDETSPPDNFIQLYRQLLNNDLDLSGLGLADADIKLNIKQILGLPGKISDAKAQLKLKNSKLSIPMQLNMADVNLQGQFEANANQNASSLMVKLWTHEEDIGDLAQLILGVKGIKGKLGRFELKAQAQGSKIREALENLDVKMHIDKSHLSYGNTDGNKAVNFDIDTLNFSLPPAKPLNIKFIGSLLNQPLSINIDGDSIAQIAKSEQGQLQLKAQAKNAYIDALADYSIKNNQPSFNLEFKLNSSDARNIANWFGLQNAQKVPFIVSGIFNSNENAWHLKDLAIKLASSDLKINANRSGLKQRPLLTLNIEGQQIDANELEKLMPDAQSQKNISTNKKQSNFNLNIPILPKGLDLSDADIRTNIKQINGPSIIVKNVEFNARIRDGYMNTSPFLASINSINYDGAILLDMRSSDPGIKLWLNANQVNIGAMLKELKITQDLEAHFNNINLYLESHASLLGDLIAQAKLIAVLNQGEIKLKDPSTKSSALIKIEQGTLTASPKEKLSLKLLGAINQAPISINLETSSTKDLLDAHKNIPIDLVTKISNTSLNLSGNLSRDIDEPNIHLQLHASGEKLSDLNQLLNSDIPPWGPWNLSGSFHMNKDSYLIKNLSLQMGDSTLEGNGSLLTSSHPPKGDIRLRAKKIRLEDFSMDEWSRNQKNSAVENNKTNADKRAVSNKIEQFLSPAMLKKANLNLEIAVDQVSSGRDKLGQGQFNFELMNGTATIGPAYIETEGGKALWSLKYHPTEKNIQLDLHVDTHQFDYGIIARRVKPNSDIKGRLNFKMNVSSTAPHLADLMSYGNGNLDLMIWPENQKSGSLDLWAVNILSGLLPVIDPAQESKINCAIGKFKLEKGILKEKQLQIDTSKMRVNGVVLADFKTEEIYAKVRPQAKEVQFLSLSTPVQVTGKFDHFNIGLSAGDIAETIVRLGTSIFWVPIKKLFSEKMVADGSDICLATEQMAKLTFLSKIFSFSSKIINLITV